MSLEKGVNMFTVGGLKFWFDHRPEETGRFPAEEFEGIKPVPYKGITICYAEDNLSRELVLEGRAFCSLQDKFDKAKGRKVALSHAIDGMSKDDRTDVWHIYTKTTSRL